jgi:hypothetical protein
MKSLNSVVLPSFSTQYFSDFLMMCNFCVIIYIVKVQISAINLYMFWSSCSQHQVCPCSKQAGTMNMLVALMNDDHSVYQRSVNKRTVIV